ncbi:ferredoxin [Candidimonas sp. SYP-B2681]|uniref:ferredoxin n=1 Tax=Candidimonas sp. SYP-B2681 TaxID=2497686 RepID=UPI000F88B5D4|nr:ferredoxin [Candidimonas sp. SYP-B2681]RTZ45466.1 ferredoxin [Candidimonas sp. SYP-B2681]
MKIEIDPNKCIGAGHCVAAASDLFTQNEDDGLVVLLVSSPSAERFDAAKEAAGLCPTCAITIHENE